VAGGCNGDEPARPPIPSPTESTATTLPSPSPSIEPTPSPTLAPAEGGLLKVAIPSPSTLDPMRLQDPGSLLVVRQLFEGLTRWDPTAEKVVPAAARSWSVTGGGRTFTFKLRKDLRWHDGERVTAGDFKAGFDRIATRRNASDLAYLLERVKGFIQVNQLGKGKSLRGVRVLNDSTLVIELAEPYYDWPLVLTHPGLVPIPEQARRNLDGFLSKPIGNGSFSMSRPWSPGQPIELNAFADAIQPPLLDGIRFVPFENAAESWPQLEEGNLHVSEVPTDDFDEASEKYGNTGTQPFLAGYYYGFNLESKALKSVRLRKAVNYAIDREAIADEIYQGSMVPARGIVPSGLPGFESDTCGELCIFAPDKAASLVGKLSKKSRRVSLEFTRGYPHGQVAELIASDLRASGLQVAVRSYAFPKYISRLSRGGHGIYRFGWLAEFPSPDAFLSPLFDSVSPDNYSGFESRRVDRLLDKAHATSNGRDRRTLYQAVEHAILETVPVAPIGYFLTHWAATPDVQGIEFDILGGFDAAGVSLNN
jgi:oligopeptide transport system substrate-binding protein